MSRRDRILALALPTKNEVTIFSPPDTEHIPSPQDNAPEPISPGITHKALPETTCSHGLQINGTTLHRPPIVTDINAIWSRPYAMNANKYEYDNSFDIVHDIDTSLFREPKPQTPYRTRDSLVCYETMPSDDEENNQSAEVDIFEDSDDSAKDQNYEPQAQIQKKVHNIDVQSLCHETAPKPCIVQADVHETPVHSSQKCRKETPQIKKIVIQHQPSDDIEVVENLVENVLECNSNADEVPESEENFTKSGRRRKRRKFDKPLSQRVQEKKLKEDEKMSLKEPCTTKCRKKCTTKISEKERQDIHDRFVNMNWESKGLFIKGLVEPQNVRSRTTRTVKENSSSESRQEGTEEGVQEGTQEGTQAEPQELTQEGLQEIMQEDSAEETLEGTEEGTQEVTQEITQEGTQEKTQKGTQEGTQGGTQEGKLKKKRKSFTRDVSYQYKFFVNRVRIDVCKTYFLSTLGYHPLNNTHLRKVLQKPVDEQKDMRGSYKRDHVIDKNLIITHINSYNPTVSHYRREHAPQTLYLPSDITTTSMHQNFIERNPTIKVSFETYRKVFRELKISFAHLGNEECEQCALFKSHEQSNECSKNAACEKCLLYQKHNLKYKTARDAYKADVIAATTDEQTVYCSVDLQKVIMLPRMEQYKIAIFCPHIIAFNESFVPLGKTKDGRMPFAVLWNETISGRNQEDILSAFRCFLLHNRDAKHVVIWADNCAAQNKNWALMCFLVNMVNSELTATETITVKYFEPGHSFMSADHFHHQVEMSLKKKKKVYDFADFIDAVQNANSGKTTVHAMSVADFFMFEDSSSQHKIRKMEPRVYLRDIMSVKAEKGHYTIKFKDNLELEWKELDFLQMKVKKNKEFPNAVSKSEPRGIAKERKDEIIAKLVPLMPENRRVFWNTLPESSKAHPNLATEN